MDALTRRSSYSGRVKKPVNERALAARIRVRLPKGEKLEKISGALKEEMGDYIHVRGANVVETHVDLEQFARKINALSPHEILKK